VGEFEGDADGLPVGLEDGERLGEVEGLVVGLDEGLEVGLDEGLKLGEAVGEDVGLNVGLAVGVCDKLGVSDGMDVGQSDIDGFIVGCNIVYIKDRRDVMFDKRRVRYILINDVVK